MAFALIADELPFTEHYRTTAASAETLKLTLT